MVKIVLLCNAGMSTSLLVNKMREHASNVGFECEINAYASLVAADHVAGAHVVLIGPQIRHQLKDLKSRLAPIPVEAIDTVAYGMMDGKRVIDQVKKLIAS